MMKMRVFVLAAFSFVVFSVAKLGSDLLHGAEVTPLSIGDAAPDFKLPGVDGKDYSLADFKAAKLLAVVFTCNHCPTAQAYEERIAKLHADYEKAGVALVAISPNDPLAVRLDELGYSDLGDSLADMKLRAAERDFKFPYLYDGETQETSRKFGVIATPQVFLFDQERKLRYTGRIDDNEVQAVTSHDARNAIDALLAGKAVDVVKTRVTGCSTKWSDKRVDVAKSLANAEAEPVELNTIDEAAVVKLARNDTDKLLLINVWATWCGPCVKELPDLVEINRMYRGRNFHMATISVDESTDQATALKLLQSKHVAAANYLSTVGSKDKLAEALDKDWPGPVPYTVLIAPGGKVLYRHLGEIESLVLRRAIVDYLGRTYAAK